MKKQFLKFFLLAVLLGGFAQVAEAQKKRTATKRASTRKTTKTKTTLIKYFFVFVFNH